MSPPVLEPPWSRTVKPETLTPLSFSQYGSAIAAPLPAAQTTIPKNAPLPQLPYPSHQSDPVVANQSTALKYSPISPMVNRYNGAPSHAPGKGLMSLFSCFPRRLDENGNLGITILERHPFTTQTFTPLGLAADDPDTFFLVVVAPSLSNPLPAATESGVQALISHPPDLSKLTAFVAHGGQAVTYGAGTWHAPMAILGSRRVDFVVSQFVSGVAEEDVQEVRVGRGIGVKVDKGRSLPKL